MKCKLRQVMKERNMTQKELAQKTGLTESMISYMASNKRVCTVRVALQLMNALQCSLTDLWEV